MSIGLRPTASRAPAFARPERKTPLPSRAAPVAARFRAPSRLGDVLDVRLALARGTARAEAEALIEVEATAVLPD